MTPLLASGEPRCDSCGRIHGADLASALALGWGYWSGQTNGGSDKEHVICRDCRTTGHKRAIKPTQQFEDEPMF